MARLAMCGLLGVACGDDDGGDAGVDASIDTAIDAPAVDAPGVDAPGMDAPGVDASVDAATPPAFVGGDERPTRVIVPPGYDPSTPAPLLILLHGYTVNGLAQNAYFGLTRKAGERGLLLLAPDGLMDSLGNRHWNATPACCGSTRPADDLAYVTSLIDEMEAGYNVDSSRIYLLGHSNGGFMSYRMACDAADRITAIASLAGSTFFDPARCDPVRPVSVLQIHGTADSTIRYDGFTGGYPSAPDTVQRFADRAGCTSDALGDPIDFDSRVAGDETTTRTWSGCDGAVDAALWSIVDGGHIPPLAEGATDAILDWLLAHSL